MEQNHSVTRRYFLTGLFTVLPLVLTLYLLKILVSFLGSFCAPFLQPVFNRIFGEEYHPFYLEFSSFVLTMVAIWIVGAIVSHLLFGRNLIVLFEKVLERIPFFSGIYGTVRKLTEFVSPISQAKYKRVVLIPFPHPGSYAIGFMTAEGAEEIQYRTKEFIVNVFVPTAPSPTSGFLVFIPKKDVIPLSMSVDDAIKMIISGGIAVPKFNPEESPKEP